MKLNILFFLFFLSLLASKAYGLGISPPSTETYFEPNKELFITATVMETEGREAPIHIFVRNNSYFTDSVEILSEQDFVLSPMGNHEVRMRVHFPDEAPIPGMHRVFVIASEDSSKTAGGGIGAVAAVGTLIRIFVEYDGPAADLALTVPNSAKDAIIPITISANSVGNDTISEVSGRFDISYEGKQVASFPMKPIRDIPPRESKGSITEWDSRGFTVGTYHVAATMNYYTKTKVMEQDFRIGTENIVITSVTGKAVSGKINPFVINLQSQWNVPISDVYADVVIKLGDNLIETLKTSSAGIQAWERKNITTYWDTKVPEGEYTATTTLHFLGKQSVATTSLKVVPKGSELSSVLPASISTTTLLVAILIIVVVIATAANMMIMFKLKK